MTRPQWLNLCLVFVIACAPSGETGTDSVVATVGALSISDSYAPASPAPDVASLYFTISNSGDADTLLTISTSAGGHALLHRTASVNGSSRMEPVHTVVIPANDRLRLAPGGYHVMLTALPAPLRVGDTLTVTLEFSRTPAASFVVPVMTYTDVVTRIDQQDN